MRSSWSSDCGQGLGGEAFGVASPFDEVGVGIVAVQGKLRLHRVSVRREGVGFDQDAITIRGGAVETQQQQVQVDGQRVHRNHFVAGAAKQARKARCSQAMERHPRLRNVEVAGDAALRPVVEHAGDAVTRRVRHQAERIATQVQRWIAVSRHRPRELVAIVCQRIAGIKRARRRSIRRHHPELPGCVRTGWLGTASPLNGAGWSVSSQRPSAISRAHGSSL